MLFSTPFILLFLTAILQKGNALPQGAPKKICQSMMPYHGGGIPPQEDASPFNIRLRRHNDGKILVTIASPIRSPFQGFMLQARTPFGNLMGGFDPGAQNHIHTIDCADFGDTLTHSNTDRKDQVEVEWLSPEDYDGPILFNATIAQSYNTFWVGVESQTVQVGKRYAEEPIPDVGQGFAGNGPSSTTPPNFRPEVARESSTEFDPFYTGCASSKLCFGSPDGCLKSKNCKAAVAITVTGDKYDFELKATGDPAWVGVGLSDDTKMGDDSVIECAKRSNGAAGIGAYMSWTSAPPAGYAAERLSNPRLGVQLLNSSLIDGVMYCKVRRDARTTVRGKVFDLLNDQFYLLIAAGTSLKPGGVGFHDITFLPSGSKQALSDTATVAGASKLLIRLHGSFMLAAWIGTTSIGILLARYYRTTWVGSTLCGKDLWFAWHRMFMILTWSLTMTAFILIFVEIGRWTDERTNPHAILGTVTTILCFLQPIGAYFRPHPGTPKRQIFNWLHWLGGNAAHIIAIVTIFYAVKLTKAELPEFVIYILAAYVAFHVVVHLVLSIMGCVSEKSSERRVSSFPMKDLGGSGRSSAYADRNADSAYSNFRKFVLAIYIVVILGLVIALIVIAAIPTIGQYWTEWRNSMNS